MSAGQRNNTAVSTRPRKAPTLQAFGEQTKAAVAPVQALDEVATFAPEHEDVAREWILRQHGLHLRGQAVETAAHIRKSGGNPDARVCERTNHRLRHWITTRSVSAEVFDQVHTALGSEAAVEVLMVIARYSGLALMLNALDVDLDESARLPIPPVRS